MALRELDLSAVNNCIAINKDIFCWVVSGRDSILARLRTAPASDVLHKLDRGGRLFPRRLYTGGSRG